MNRDVGDSCLSHNDTDTVMWHTLYSAAECLKVVTTHLESKQLLPFGY